MKTTNRTKVSTCILSIGDDGWAENAPFVCCNTKSVLDASMSNRKATIEYWLLFRQLSARIRLHQIRFECKDVVGDDKIRYSMVDSVGKKCWRRYITAIHSQVNTECWCYEYSRVVVMAEWANVDKCKFIVGVAEHHQIHWKELMEIKVERSWFRRRLNATVLTVKRVDTVWKMSALYKSIGNTSPFFYSLERFDNKRF